MNAPSAKTEFSNDHLGKVITDLIAKGHRVEFTPGPIGKLTIHGDLDIDLNGLGCHVTVFDGDVHSNVSIAGELIVENSDYNDKSVRKINLRNTKIKANNITIRNDGAIVGEGEILTIKHGGSVSANYIGGEDIIINAGFVHVDEQLSFGVTVFAEHGINARVISGAHVVSPSIQSTIVDGGATIITDYCEIGTIENGARVFSYGEFRCNQFGSIDPNHSPVLIVANKGFKEKQFRMEEIYAHNAIIFSPDAAIFDDVQVMRIGKYPLPTVMTNSFADLSEEQIDFIRQGYDIARKHWDKSMPEHVSSEIHKRFTPA